MFNYININSILLTLTISQTINIINSEKNFLFNDYIPIEPPSSIDNMNYPAYNPNNQNPTLHKPVLNPPENPINQPDPTIHKSVLEEHEHTGNRNKPIQTNETLHTYIESISNATNSVHFTTVIRRPIPGNDGKRNRTRMTTTNSQPRGLVDYSDLHVDPITRTLEPPTRGIPRDKLDHEEKICYICACTHDYSTITCTYNRAYNGKERKKLVLTEDLIPKTAYRINIRGYDVLEIKPNTFASNVSMIDWILIEEIKEIKLHRNSFLFNPKARANYELTVQIIKSSIPHIPTQAFTQWIAGRHGRSDRNKLKQTRFISLEFISCFIGKMSQNALTSSRLLYFNITSTQIKEMAHHSIDLDVYQLAIFRENIFPSLMPEAICLHARIVVFRQNIFAELKNESISIEAGGQVLFDSNQVDILGSYALIGIEPMEDAIGANLVFIGNNIIKAHPNSLMLNPGYPEHEKKILNTTFHIDCKCNISDHLVYELIGIEKTDEKERDIYDDIFETSSRRSHNKNHLMEFSKCQQSSTSFILVDTYVETDCKQFPIIIILSLTFAAAFIIISICIAVICTAKLRKARGELNSLGHCTSESFSTIARGNNQYENDRYNTSSSHGSRGPCNIIDMNLYGTASNPPGSPGIESPLSYPWVTGVPQVKMYQQNELDDFTERAESMSGTLTQNMNIRSSKMMDDKDKKFRRYLSQNVGDKEQKNHARKSCPYN